MLKTILLTLTFSLCSFKAHSFVVLLDPGHGGAEVGAKGKLLLKNSKGKTYSRAVYEKDLSLKLAVKVKKILDEYFTVYLTRSFDRKVSLQDRAAMADTVKADLFISIHFNASAYKSSAGFETYYLDNHKDKAIKKVENIENKNLEGEDKIINQILIDLVIEKTVNSSKKLANLIHGELETKVGKKFKMKNREVKPGLFYVLALSKRPGVLIEAGFLTNPIEVKKLNSDNYLNSYALGISEGIIRYQQSLPKRDLPLF